MVSAILLDLMGYEIHTYPITARDWAWAHHETLERRWPPLILWGDRAFVKTPRYKSPDDRYYHEVRTMVIGDTSESGSRKLKRPT